MDERRYHRATEVDKSTPQRRSRGWWRSEGIFEIRKKGGNNTWAYHREMDLEVSQYLETECRHSIDQWRRRCLSFVLTSVECMERATSIAELNFTWGRMDLQWRCRRADSYYDLREKGRFSFPTNRCWTSREESIRRTPIAIRWRSVVTSKVFLTVCWTSVGFSERCQTGRYHSQQHFLGSWHIVDVY